MAQSARPSEARSKRQPDPRSAVPELEARVQNSKESFEHSLQLQERARFAASSGSAWRR